MPTPLRILFCLTTFAASTLAACGGDEIQGTADHTPVAYVVLVDGTEATPPFTLTQGETVRVRLKFTNAANEDLDGVEGEHFGGLAFEPASLATVARVTGHNYQFDVTGGTPGGGTVQVSYGHDEMADETAFTPVDVTVEPAP